MHTSPTRRALLPSALLALAGSALANASDPLVRLQYAAFDPVLDHPALPPSLVAGPDNHLFLVQFHRSPSPSDRQALAGAVIERFLTDHTYIVRLDDPIRAAEIASRPAVRWVGPYHPAFRLAAGVRDEALGLDGHQPRRYSIECMRPHQPRVLAAFIVSIGGAVDCLADASLRLEASLDPTQLLLVAARDEVSFVDPWGGPAGADMDIARLLGNAVPLLEGLGLTGRGVRGELIDTEIDLNHPAFQNPPPLLHGPYIPGAPAHGSASFGICFANWPQFPQLTGLLPDREQGIFAQYSQLTWFGGSIPIALLLQQATDPAGPYRAAFVASSVGNAQTSQYTTYSAETDFALFHADVLMVQSMSNTGNQLARPQAWAKNIVTVGGINHLDTLARADDTAGTSTAFGPAADGRVKPDLAHCNDNILTTWTSSQPPGYVQFSGTSAATSITAGYFGLIVELVHREAFRGLGGGASPFADRPRAATLRALAFNAAFRYDWLSGGPNASITRRIQGWGMIDPGSLYLRRDKTLVINETDPVVHGQVRSYSVNVSPDEPLLAATMVFTEPPGTPAAQQARVNDLSLRLSAPDGTIYWGNNGLWAGNASTPGGTPNTIDPCEHVLVPSPAPGTWIVDVIASEVVLDARLEDPEVNADFGLVVSGISLPPLCPANCDGSTAPPVLNVADFTCFLNRYAAGSLRANCDGSTLAPALNVADFICFLNAFARGCP